MILGMKLVGKLRLFGRSLREIAPEVAESIETASHGSALLRTLVWAAAGAGALAAGMFVGRELRQRYKFTRRTPYDFYAHSGDRMPDVEFGVGV